MINARLTILLALSACMAAGCENRQEALPLGEVPGTNAIPSSTSGAHDDWPTFAYDYKRTGYNPTVKNITTANVGKLQLRWKVNITDEQINASPVVYDGNIILVTLGVQAGGASSYVYDLSTVDGHTIWRFHIGGLAKMTPTIDPAAGLVIVGNENFTNRKTVPSHMFALNLLDGKLVWQGAPNIGIYHAPPVVTGGTIYAGLAGGDAPLCAQGGILSINETTGAVNWQWAIDPTPHEGGGVWGAIAYDGTQPIFGTGNTCEEPVLTSDGAVALNADGKPSWNMIAEKDSMYDADTGGGVMLYKDRAYFINKNGIFYVLDEATGKIIWQKVLNPYAQRPTWNGGFASPTTDGSTIVIGTGLYKGTTTDSGGDFCFLNSAPQEVIKGYHSQLAALNLRGHLLWTREMQNRITGYVALIKGLGFVGLNEEFDALDLKTGKTLWSYPTPNYIDSSMVVVPSGVYGADESGNVYAFGLPTTKK